MKKFLLMITIFLCMTPTVFGAERFNYNNNWNDDYLGIENIKMIFRKMEYTDYNDAILNQTYDNFIIRYAEFKELYPSATLYNLVFFAMEEIIDSPTDIGVSLSNGSFSDETIPYIKMEASSSTNDILTYVNNRNESGTLATNFQIYNGRLQNYGGVVNITQFTVDDTENDAYIIDGNIFSWNPAYTVLYRTEFGFLTNSLPGLLIDEGVFYEPEIPEEPENPDNPSGDIGSGDIGSGDNNENIQESIQNGIVQGNTEYWGSSGDLTGEKQEEIISGKVDKLTEQISGDLAENEIFGILQKYEDKIFGGFTGEEDFKIKWNNVSYAGGVIIPKGEINFSKMCRENETLGNVKTTVNIILGFFLLSNCVIYLYNLLLATLGIDNPYLYETPPEQVETVTFDTNMNTGETMMTQTTKKRDGTTFRLRRKL